MARVLGAAGHRRARGRRGRRRRWRSAASSRRTCSWSTWRCASATGSPSSTRSRPTPRSSGTAASSWSTPSSAPTRSPPLRRGAQDVLVAPVRDAELLARVQAAGRTKILQEELVEQTRRLEPHLFEDPLTAAAQPPLPVHPAPRAGQRRPPSRAPAVGGHRRPRPLQGASTTRTATRSATRVLVAVGRRAAERAARGGRRRAPRRRGVPRAAARHRRRGGGARRPSACARRCAAAHGPEPVTVERRLGHAGGGEDADDLAAPGRRGALRGQGCRARPRPGAPGLLPCPVAHDA